jgi:hypothetical protein
VSGGLELARPRDISALFGDALGVYVRHAGVFLAIAAGIVLPAQAIVSGVGLEQLTARYDDSSSPGELVLPSVVSFLVVAPLVTATCIHALHASVGGRPLHAGRALTAGLEAFAPVFLAVLLAAAGIALGLVALVGPGIYLLVRWYFVPQAVVIEGARGSEALRGSGRLVQGFWWRSFGIVLMANLAAFLPGFVILVPFDVAARAADREGLSLLGSALAETVTAPFVALVATLLYYDLRARGR